MRIWPYFDLSLPQNGVNSDENWIIMFGIDVYITKQVENERITIFLFRLISNPFYPEKEGKSIQILLSCFVWIFRYSTNRKLYFDFTYFLLSEMRPIMSFCCYRFLSTSVKPDRDYYNRTYLLFFFLFTYYITFISRYFWNIIQRYFYIILCVCVCVCLFTCVCVYKLILFLFSIPFILFCLMYNAFTKVLYGS